MSGTSPAKSRKLRDKTPGKPLARPAPYSPEEQAKYKKRVIEGKEYNEFNPQSLEDAKQDAGQDMPPTTPPLHNSFEDLVQLIRDNGGNVDESILKEIWDETPKGTSADDLRASVNACARWFMLGQTNYETLSNVQTVRYAQTALPNYVTGLANTASAMTSAIQRLEKILPGLEKSYDANNMTEGEMVTMALSIYRSKTSTEKYRMIVDYLVNEVGYTDFYSDMTSPVYKDFAVERIRSVDPEVVAAITIFSSSKLPSLGDRIIRDRKALQTSLSKRMVH
ncbi:phosphoprotein [Potato yellow dwarf virus]|uniref:Phosphoprotein n=1 Tax=constricta yellow dwarf virus TaxID=3020400 RepID=A0A1W6BQL1_9RHAB|nr:phosphoprotein [Potato yellow dwarf virus]ARJ54293.1 phosphoprotein [constricta yellow dwarf virus]